MGSEELPDALDVVIINNRVLPPSRLRRHTSCRPRVALRGRNHTTPASHLRRSEGRLNAVGPLASGWSACPEGLSPLVVDLFGVLASMCELIRISFSSSCLRLPLLPPPPM